MQATLNIFNALHKSCKKLKFKSFLIRSGLAFKALQPQSNLDVKNRLIKYCANTHILIYIYTYTYIYSLILYFQK